VGPVLAADAARAPVSCKVGVAVRAVYRWGFA
jgi:hypothetical protein